jgi:hypothetical protein
MKKTSKKFPVEVLCEGLLLLLLLQETIKKYRQWEIIITGTAVVTTLYGLLITQDSIMDIKDDDAIIIDQVVVVVGWELSSRQVWECLVVVGGGR